MKKLVCCLLFLTFSLQINATEQQPDYLFYEGQKLLLSTGWGHPSPLETYFLQTNVNSPFRELHTANYRGHVATWAIRSNKLYLKEVSVRGKKQVLSKIGIRSKPSTALENGSVFADWFSGVIEADLFVDSDERRVLEKTYFIHIRYGKLVNIEAVTAEDFKLIRERPKGKKQRQHIEKRKDILKLNHDYISYYFRLNEREVVSIDAQQGILTTKTGFSPILAFYQNDHMKWPFNWENPNKNGAPNGRWVIIDDKLFLEEVVLRTGTSFYEVEEIKLEFKEIFDSQHTKERILAKWVSGVIVIELGKLVKDELVKDYEEFKVSEYIYIDLKEGHIVDSHRVKAGFNFEQIPENTLPGLRLLIKRFRD